MREREAPRAARAQAPEPMRSSRTPRAAGRKDRERRRSCAQSIPAPRRCRFLKAAIQRSCRRRSTTGKAQRRGGSLLDLVQLAPALQRLFWPAIGLLEIDVPITQLVQANWLPAYRAADIHALPQDGEFIVLVTEDGLGSARVILVHFASP